MKFDISNASDLDEALYIAPGRTQKQLELFMSEIPLQDDATVLDVGAGRGRIAVPLAMKGYHVHAIDIDAHRLKIISELKGIHKLNNLTFETADFFNKKFTTAVLPFAAIIMSYAALSENSSTAMHMLLSNCFRNLKDGGTFILDLLNRDYIVKNASTTPIDVTHRAERCLPEITSIVRTRLVDVLQSTEENIYCVETIRGQELQIRYTQYLFDLETLSTYLKEEGFHIAKVFGNYDKSEYTNESSRIIIIANK